MGEISMKKLKTFFVIIGIISVLFLVAFVSPLRDKLINQYFYMTGDYPHGSALLVPEKLPAQLGSWSVDKRGWRYTNNDGESAINQNLLIGGNEYFFDADGYLATGWSKLDDDWYYLSYTGFKHLGWLELNDRRYYFDRDGKMATGWQNIYNKNYYFKDNGELTSGWIEADNTFYYINEDGSPRKGWLLENGKYYYLANDGAMQTGWIEEDNFWYYLNEDGTMTTEWQSIDDKLHYFGETGQMYTGWLSSNGNTYFFDNDGSITTGWLQLGEYSYYMDHNSGAMHSDGWIYDGDSAYYLDRQGIWVPNKNDGGGTIALTFDDGPGQYTDRLLSTLEANQARATFFVLGQLVDRYPATLQKMLAIGCEIGNHSYSHPNLTTLDEATIRNEIASTDQKIKNITGTDIKYMRPPGGNHNEAVRGIINRPFIMWSLDTLDWQSKNTKTVVEKVLNNVKDGDIILMHDIHPTSIEASEVLIPTLQSMGYNLVTVSELAQAKGVTIQNQGVYNRF